GARRRPRPRRRRQPPPEPLAPHAETPHLRARTTASHLCCFPSPLTFRCAGTFTLSHYPGYYAGGAGAGTGPILDMSQVTAGPTTQPSMTSGALRNPTSIAPSSRWCVRTEAVTSAAVIGACRHMTCTPATTV